MIAVAAAMIGSLASAQVTFNLDQEFSGGQAPAGPPPWLTATFTQNGANHVTLTLSAAGLTNSENASEWDFNVTDAFVGNLIFGSEIKSGTFDTPTISQGLNAFKADGDGDYDISFGFTTGGVANKVFGAGETDTWDISATGLTANDFNQLSAPDGGHGPFFTAAHVQNTTGAGSGGSGWISPSVPEPSATLLVPLGGILGFVLRFRLRR
jgi:hypothetical protein